MHIFSHGREEIDPRDGYHLTGCGRTHRFSIIIYTFLSIDGRHGVSIPPYKSKGSIPHYGIFVVESVRREGSREGRLAGGVHVSQPADGEMVGSCIEVERGIEIVLSATAEKQQ